MRRIKGANTAPEIRVRRLLHQLGYRFRLHKAGLPGKPDILLPKYSVAIFVHGCFWHGHKGCRRAKLPSTRLEFWRQKIQGNRRRDSQVRRNLRNEGYAVIEIWQCEIAKTERLTKKLVKLIESNHRYDGTIR